MCVDVGCRYAVHCKAKQYFVLMCAAVTIGTFVCYVDQEKVLREGTGKYHDWC